MKKRSGWPNLLLALGLCGGMCVCGAFGEVSKYTGITTEQRIEGTAPLVELMRSEGLSKENLYLKGQLVCSATARFAPEPYTLEGRLVQWHFREGVPGCMDEFSPSDTVSHAEAGDGTLKLSVAGKGSIAFGDMGASQRSLNFGYTGREMQPTRYIQVRMRQSLPTSTWQVQYRKGNKPPEESKTVAVKGTDWQVVTFDFGFHRKLGPPVTGVRLSMEGGPVLPVADVLDDAEGQADDPANNVEIEWVRPAAMGGRACYRKELALPDGARWAKVSVVSGPHIKLYVNGKKAVNDTRSVDMREMWHYDIDPTLFRAGQNTLAFECGMMAGGMHQNGRWIMDGAILCKDGSYHRMDSDATWKFSSGLTGQDWIQPGYDDSQWGKTTTEALARRFADIPLGYWFNPSYKGRIMVDPGRDQPVYGVKEPIALRVSVPAQKGKIHSLTWEAFDEMGDGFHGKDELVDKGTLTLRRQRIGALQVADAQVEGGNPLPPFPSDHVGLLTFKAGALSPNHAYAVVLHLTEDGKEIETRRYEVAVCGPVEQPVVENPTNYTDGMELKLVWELDPTQELEAGSFICRDSSRRGDAVPSKVVETPLGRFRSTWAQETPGGHKQGGVYMSFKYQVKNLGRPHLAMAEYPDDSVRIQEMHLSELPGPSLHLYDGGRNIANDMVQLGIAPLSHKIRHHHCVFWPTMEAGTVTFYATGLQHSGAGWDPNASNARVGRIRIYEIANGIPVRRIQDAPGPKKWIGQCSEAGVKTIMESCANGALATHFRHKKRTAIMPNFYRYWMMTYQNLVQRMRFAGENAVFAGQYQYGSISTPSEFSEHIHLGHDGGDLNDYGVLMSRMLEENDMGWFTHTEMTSFSRLKPDCSPEDLADGKPTLGQVDSRGRLHTFFRNSMVPNYVHPEFRENYFNRVIDEWVALYGKHKGWKGIALQINEALGPCWLCKNGDPYFASYDDYTITLFEKETGTAVPVPKTGLERFGQRKEWLLANAKAEWTKWRSDKMTEIYQWVSDRLKAARPDLQLVLYTQAETYIFPDHFGSKESDWMSVQDAAMRGGLDKDAMQNSRDIVLAYSIRDAHGGLVAGQGKRSALSVIKSRSRNLMPQISNDGINGLALRKNFWEVLAYVPPGSEDSHWPWERCKTHAYEHQPDEYFGEFKVNAFVRGNPTLMALPFQDFSITMGREVWSSRFAKAYRSLPVARYVRLTGNGRDKNVWIEVAQYGNDTYGYIANNQNWNIDATVQLAAGLKVTDLMLDKPIGGPAWKPALGPYMIQPFHAENADPDGVVLSCEAVVCERGTAAVHALLEKRTAETQRASAVLKELGKEQDVQDELADARQVLGQGHLSAAFDSLYGSPTLLWVGTLISDFEPRKLDALKRQGKITMDGDLSDWAPGPGGALREKKQVFLQTKAWEGPSDCSGTFRLAWDDTSLYLAVEVTDEKLFFADSDKTPVFFRDSVELFLDADLKGDYGAERYNDDDTHVMLGLPVNGEGGLRVWRKRGYDRDVPVDDIRAGWQRTETGYAIECALPWKMLGVPAAVREGTEVGLDLLINDSDRNGKRQACLIWSTDRATCSRNPTRHGRIKLQGKK